MSFAAIWVDLEIIILSEVSQAEKDKHCMVSFIMRKLKKVMQRDLLMKQKQTPDLKNKLMVTGGGLFWEFGMDMYTLLY